MNHATSAPEWPGWETLGVIGRGSFGAVYEIQREVFGHTEKAALKVISIPQSSADIDELYNDGYDDESIAMRFQRYLEEIVGEYAMMSEMKGHTNIVYCDDLRYVPHERSIGWDVFIKMELLTPLPRALDRTFSQRQVLKIALGLCDALILCKRNQIVHRDIKPQNIFASKDGNYKLGDFGIAKTAERTTFGTKTGTYKYMAPEVYNNRPYGHSADIYSLGMVLYWLCNERRTPFLPLPPLVPTATEEELARDRRFGGEPIPRPKYGSSGLQQIILKACAFDPRERYATAMDMKRDLLALCAQLREGDPEEEKMQAEEQSPRKMLLIRKFPMESLKARVLALAARYSDMDNGEEMSREERKKLLLFTGAACIVFLALSVLLVALVIHSALEPIKNRTAAPLPECPVSATVCWKEDTETL